MSERYKIIFSLDKCLYKETAPVIIKSGALVSDTEKGKLHIQLKYQSIAQKEISLLKAKIVAMDSIGRTLETVEKQYLDLNVKQGEEFGGNVPIAIKEFATRQFSAVVDEVCFSDGSIWCNENAVWEDMPKLNLLESKFTTKECVNQFKYAYCKQAKYVPVRYKDIWVCACGSINKAENGKCSVCGAELAVMELVDEKVLNNDNIYRNAVKLSAKNNASDLKKAISLFQSIIDWKDSRIKIEEINSLLKIAEAEEEKAKQVRLRKMNLLITPVSLLLSVCGIIAFFFPVIKFKSGEWGGIESVINGFNLLTMNMEYFFDWSRILMGILAWLHLIGTIVLITFNIITLIKKTFNQKVILSTFIGMPLIGLMYLIKGIVSISIDNEVITFAYIPLILISIITIIGVCLVWKSKKNKNV